MRVFDDILDALSDGKEHPIEDIRFRAARDLNESQVDLVLTALAEADFITIFRSRGTAFGPLEIKNAKLVPRTLIFLKKIKELEGQEAKKSV